MLTSIVRPAAKVAFLVLVLSTPSGVLAQECLHKADESADQGTRRQAAIRYLAEVNAAQTRSQQERGRYLPLNEVLGIDHTPVGFLPRLLFDHWAYLISLKDFFDPCGFTLFSDERGVIYESHPTAINESVQAQAQTATSNGEQ